jgi:hypothetical protein
MALRGHVNLDLDVEETLSADLGSASWAYRTVWTNAFANGSGNGQANKVFQDLFSLAGSGSVSYDLSGALVGPMGAAVVFTRIYALCFQRTDAYDNPDQDENLLLGGNFILTKYLLPGADVLSAVRIPIGPRGLFCAVFPGPDGVGVTASTGDVVTLTNASSGDTVAGRTLILGS